MLQHLDYSETVKSVMNPIRTLKQFVTDYSITIYMSTNASSYQCCEVIRTNTDAGLSYVVRFLATMFVQLKVAFLGLV